MNRARLIAVNEAGEFRYEMPVDHSRRVGKVAPEGGASCENCQFVSGDYASCANFFFVAWLTGQRIKGQVADLPAPADSYFCDFWALGETEGGGLDGS